MMVRLTLAFAAVVLALHQAPGASQQPAPGTAHPARNTSALVSVLETALARGSAPGISAAILMPDGELVTLAAGVSNRETRAVMQATDRMPIGSVGKTIAAARAVQLIEQGLLKLDEPIATYLGAEPWFEKLPNGKAMTVRHLMTHTSGLPRYEFAEAFTRDLRADPDREWTVEQRLAYVVDHAPAFAPGQGWQYADTNYILLGAIIERVHGQSFYVQARRGITIRMRKTGLTPLVTRAADGYAQGYTGADDPILSAGGAGPVIVDGRFVVNPQVEWTGGGYAGSAVDLARWAALLFNGRAFARPEMVRLMIDAAVPATLGPDTAYGLGVIVRRSTPVGEVWGHSGYFPGYLTEMIYLPARGVAIAVQINSSDARANGVTPLGVAYELARETF